jgi:hypothetical protein
MNEQEWLSSDDPQAMLSWLTETYKVPAHSMGTATRHERYPSDRKLQLWMEAVSSGARRPVDDPDANTQQHLTLPLRWATAKHVHLTFAQKANLLRCIVGNPFSDALKCTIGTWRHLLTWNSAIIPSLALAAYEERLANGTLDPLRLAILADALEEAGCDASDLCSCEGGWLIRNNGDRFRCDVCKGIGRLHRTHPLLAHLRSPGPHVHGCWCLDLILGKS